MKIISHGAAGVVTGSCHQIITDCSNFLIDCGMFQGDKELTRLNYRNFDFHPEEIDFLIVTHGHIDHIGLIPKLVKAGFRGPVYTTPATADLIPVMLMDAAFIQEKDTEHENRRRLRQGKEPREPLYTRQDVESAVKSIKPMPYEEKHTISDELSFRLRDAGHVIGSAIVELFLTLGNKETKLVFSGDLGQRNVPIIEDPTFIMKADYVYMESTYGNRLHKRPKPRREELLDAVRDTYARGGKLLIPSFALERTQELLYLLSDLKTKEPDFPNLKVYLDSPLAIKITEVFRNHPDIYDEEARSRKDKPFDFPGLIISETPQDSMRINHSKEPCIVIAGSGMCTAGRIRHHFKHSLWDERTTVLFVGYQAPGTLGRIILDGAKTVRMMGMEIAVNAEIRRIGSFSAHGDRDDLINWLEAFEEKPKKVFLIHGEESEMKKFALRLREQGFAVEIPRRGEVSLEL